MNDEHLMNDLTEKMMKWLNIKSDLMKSIKDINNLFHSFVGRTFKYKNAKYKIEKIILENECHFYGGYLFCKRQRSSFIGNILFQNETYINFYDFYNGLNKGEFILEKEYD
jgi:hypothetical protein